MQSSLVKDQLCKSLPIPFLLDPSTVATTTVPLSCLTRNPNACSSPRHQSWTSIRGQGP